MIFKFFYDVKNDEEGNFLTSIIMNLGEWVDESMSKRKNGELYYVYAYTFEDVYVTKQGSTKVELLIDVSSEFKQSLAEGFILRYKDGKFEIDEELTEKSMNFELDFDNYNE